MKVEGKAITAWSQLLGLKGPQALQVKRLRATVMASGSGWCTMRMLMCNSLTDGLNSFVCVAMLHDIAIASDLFLA